MLLKLTHLQSIQFLTPSLTQLLPPGYPLSARPMLGNAGVPTQKAQAYLLGTHSLVVRQMSN